MSASISRVVYVASLSRKEEKAFKFKGPTDRALQIYLVMLNTFGKLSSCRDLIPYVPFDAHAFNLSVIAKGRAIALVTKTTDIGKIICSRDYNNHTSGAAARAEERKLIRGFLKDPNPENKVLVTQFGVYTKVGNTLRPKMIG